MSGPDGAIRVAGALTDRTAALHDGNVCVEGRKVTFHPMRWMEAFTRLLAGDGVDAAEMSFTMAARAASLGDPELVVVPAFPLRAFRHSGVLVRADDPATSAAELNGRSIGVVSWQMTAGMWMRGILAEHDGLDVDSVDWVVGSIDGLAHRLSDEIPDGVRARRAPWSDLEQAVADGHLDAVITPLTPTTVLTGELALRPLWPDVGAVERAYHAATGFFPVMHAVALRAEDVRRDPSLPTAVYGAHLLSKRRALESLQHVGHMPTAMPWLTADVMDAAARFGADWWRYGLEANRAELETGLRYAHEQRITDRLLTPDEVFAPLG